MGRGKHKQKKRMRRQKLASKGVYSGQSTRIGVLNKEREERATKRILWVPSKDILNIRRATMSNESIVQEWNELYPPGTEVLLTNDDGKIEETKTRSIAWLLGSGHPVVSVEGRTGGYSLERIQPKQPILKR